MIERNKQVNDQQKKHAEEKARKEHPQNDARTQTGQQKAGMTTDPEAAKDKDFAKRIEEKTNTH